MPSLHTLLTFGISWLPLIVVAFVIVLAISLNPEDMHTMLELVGIALPVSMALAYAMFALHLFAFELDQPSIRTVLTMTLASAVFIYYRKQGFALIVISILVGSTQVLIGSHVPLDIILSAGLAAASTLAISRLVFGINKPTLDAIHAE